MKKDSKFSGTIEWDAKEGHAHDLKINPELSRFLGAVKSNATDKEANQLMRMG